MVIQRYLPELDDTRAGDPGRPEIERLGTHP